MGVTPFTLSAIMAAIGSIVSKVQDPGIIIVGDSITNFGTTSFALNNVTLTRDSAGVVTVPSPSHPFTTGTPFSIVNAPNPEFEGLFTATVIDANTFTFQTTFISNPTTMPTAGAGTGANRHTRPGSSGYFTWLNSLCGGGLRLIANFGAASDQAAMMVNLTTIAANRPDCDIVCIMAGTNDLTFNRSAAQIVADVTALVNIVLAAGKKAIVCTIPPERTDFATTTRKNTKEAAHIGFAELAAANPGRVAFANAYPDMVDPASPIGASLPDVTYDGIHFADKGASLMAPAVKTAVDQLATYGNAFAPPLLGHSFLKSYTSASGANIGIKDAAIIGNVCIAGYSTTGNARTTAVAEVVPTADPNRFIQRYTITPGGADTLTIYLGNVNAETLASLGCAVGDSIILAAEMKVIGGTNGSLRGITAIVEGYSAEPRVSWATQSGAVSDTNKLTSYSRTVVSMPVKILPGQTRIQCTLGLAFHTAAAMPVVFEIDRIHLLRKPA